jgi:hypothetical protein
MFTVSVNLNQHWNKISCEVEYTDPEEAFVGVYELHLNDRADYWVLLD